MFVKHIVKAPLLFPLYRYRFYKQHLLMGPKHPMITTALNMSYHKTTLITFIFHNSFFLLKQLNYIDINGKFT